MTKDRLFQIETRGDLIKIGPELNNVSQGLITIASFLFAGSLTFLGLRKATPIHTIGLLKLAWLNITIVILVHIILRYMVLGAMLLHVRTDTRTENAKQRLIEGDEMGFLQDALSGHKFQLAVFRLLPWLPRLILLQGACCLVSLVLLLMFVSKNI